MARGAIVQVLHQSTSPMIIPFSTYFIFIGHFFRRRPSNNARLRGGDENIQEGWVRGHWWYRLAHVYQRWRSILLGSVSYLDISLGTTGRPVADMQASSPFLPLIIDYLNIREEDLTTEDEDGIILALRQRGHVRRVRPRISATNLQKLIMHIEEEYPILDYLVIVRRVIDNDTALIFPETLQAPHLYHSRQLALPFR